MFDVCGESSFAPDATGDSTQGSTAKTWSRYKSRMQPCAVPGASGVVIDRLASAVRAALVEYNRTRHFFPPTSIFRIIKYPAIVSVSFSVAPAARLDVVTEAV